MRPALCRMYAKDAADQLKLEVALETLSKLEAEAGRFDLEL
jgi:hypothetical protein